MKRYQICILTTLVLAALAPAPIASIVCRGSLVINNSSTVTNTLCPSPWLTKTWNISCEDPCGHASPAHNYTITGVGQCTPTGEHCNDTKVCMPLAGTELQSYNPPAFSSSIAHRKWDGSCVFQTCKKNGSVSLNTSCPCDEGAPNCAENDPLIISLNSGRYLLTDRVGGVEFDMGGQGQPGLVPWTTGESDLGFLVLDRDGNGTIDSGHELFGDLTPQHESSEPNGFRALAMFDDMLSGGNEDGRITADDSIFGSLQIWLDQNHNGYSEPEELFALSDVGIEWLDFEYHYSSRTDRHGNEFRYWAHFGFSDGTARTMWNVFLVAD